MKRILYVIFFLISYMNIILAHGQGVHQYLVRESYKLLKSYVGQDLLEMKDHVGYNEVGVSVFNPGNLLVIGTYREDEEDPVYQNGFPFGWTVTNTHFWDPDRGDGSHFNVLGIVYDNAYQKAIKYYYGGYILSIPASIPYTIERKLHVHTALGDELIIYPDEPQYGGFYLSYYSLVDLYKNSRLITQLIGKNQMWNVTKQRWEYWNGDVYVSRELRDALVWEILGRVTHLLGDMTIPAHTHNDPHPSGDSYEDWMNQPSVYNQWTYQNAITQGGLINSTLSSNPLKYLFYPTAQITNFFSSDDVDGNNTNDINDSFALYPGLSEMILHLNSEFNGPPDKTVHWLSGTSEHAFVYGIRAIAGFLYLFAKEADLLPIPLTSVYVSGTYELYLGQTGYWYTQLGNGLEPFTYNWEIIYLTGGSYLSSSLKVPIGPRLPEPGYWLHVGTNSSTFSRLNNGADLRNFKLRCTVTDGSNTTKVSNVWTVSVYSTSPPQGSIVSNDGNNAVMMKENEVEVKSVPDEFSLDQNYPNPFNPTTKISYSLPDANFVTLKIYDMLGSEVVTLVNENKTAGKFEVEFDASKLSSGTYVYKLVAGNYQITKKMQFVK